MVLPATEYQSESQGPGQLNFIQPKSSNLFVLPVVKTEKGLSVPLEVMAGIWQQIISENKKNDLFYEGGIDDLRDWVEYIYNPQNYVALVVDNLGHIYHIAWINKFRSGHGFLHHCSLGKYNRKTWPILKKYWSEMRDGEGRPIIRILLGITPVTNEIACRLVKMIGWTVLGNIPGICYLAHEKRYVSGMVSYCVLNQEG